MEVTTARILDKRRMLKKTSTYPLAIRVTFNRKSVAFPVNLTLTESDFKKLSSPRIGVELCQVRDKFTEEEQRAKRIIQNLGTFTFPAFKEEFYKDSHFRKKKNTKPQKKSGKDSDTLSQTNSIEPLPASIGKNKKYGKRNYDRIRSNVDYEKLGPLAVAYGEYIKDLEIQERIGTSEGYFSSLLSLLSFRKELRLEDITVRFLYEYERWMLNKECSLTTIGIYLRPLRAIINMRPNKKLFTEETYPFGKSKYVIPTGVNIKKALEPWELKLLYDYRPETDHADIKNELFARAMWFFGFFANGINTKDVAYLKYKNIDEEGFLVITREKTKFTTRSKPQTLIIPINEDMKLTIEEWGNPDISPDNYIFPVLTHGLSAHRRYELVQGFTSVINDWMKKIANNVGIKKKVRTMEYRHSMATVLKRSGVSTSFIQETLGHANARTTENYLDSFPLEVKKKNANLLSSFKDIQVA